MLTRHSLHIAITALWLLGSACSSSPGDGGAGGSQSGGAGGSQSGGAGGSQAGGAGSSQTGGATGSQSGGAGGTHSGTGGTSSGSGVGGAAGSTATGGSGLRDAGPFGGGTNSGGFTGQGGTQATGGSSGTGGATVTGGQTGSGGTSAAAGTMATGGSSGTGGSTGKSTGPCDIYDAAGTPCVAAHSTVRALYGAYDGKLYQVQRASDKTTKDIVALAPGSYANSAEQDSFCAGTTCTISIVYDQSPKANHLTPAPGGGANKTPDKPVNASKLKLTVGGHTVYGAYFEGGMGYRNNKTTGIATGEDPESMYMVASGKHYNNQCCFDYGNAETTNNDDGEGAMETIYFGNCTGWGKGAGSGPWVMADIENGLWAGNVTPYNGNTSITWEYVTAIVKGKPGTFGIKAGDAQSGALKGMYEGPRPAKGAWGLPYEPMKKQGAIILGIGGDNSNWAVGTFFEGCMTTGYTTNATDDAIQANIVAAGYGK